MHYICTAMKQGLFISIFVLINSFVLGQYTVEISKTNSPITVDGILNESDWKKAKPAKDFYQNFPSDSSFSETKTEVKLLFDEQFMYIAAICYDDFEGEYTIQSLKRDFSYPLNDAFAVYIDPFNDKTNGFSFGVNPMGVQREGSLENGGGWGTTATWDNKWFSKVTQQDGKWVVEMAIPFKSIRYSSDLLKWSINFSRNNLKINENSSWVPVPRQFRTSSLAFTGDLIWTSPPPKTGKNISIIPFVTGGTSKDFESGEKAKPITGTGLDAKIAVTNSLNLDLTINPDFSQVEVDVQQTNLTRFSLFFPERRQFFIENADLFSRHGFRQIRPFFSRNIGLNSGQQIPIIAGARLSGKLNENWRIGALNMHTEGRSELDLRPQNYSVGTFQRKIGARSFISGVFVNRQAFDDYSIINNDYNRVVGLDYVHASSDNKWQGRIFYHKSISPGIAGKDYAHAVWLMRNTEKWSLEWNHEFVHENYNAEVGFTPRLSNYNQETGEFDNIAYFRFEPQIRYNFYPKSKIINVHSPIIYISEYRDKFLAPTEYTRRFGYRVNFKDASRFEFNTGNQFVKLFYDTDITFTDNEPIDKGIYRFYNTNVFFVSSPQKVFSYRLNVDFGSYYIGEKYSYGGELNYRLQPWGIFSLGVNQNDIIMPDGFENATISLFSAKAELSFTKEIFFTTFVQYNTQADNMNINARLQYRFRPLSDFFLVYTDNYNTNIFGIKNRAIVAKLVYWL